MRFKWAMPRALKWRAIAERASDIRWKSCDVENRGIPVGIDAAGKCRAVRYEGNRFEEINGECIDLDGFHDSAVRGDVCVNRRRAGGLSRSGTLALCLIMPVSRCGRQDNVIEDNELDGMKFGGIFLIGTGHKIITAIGCADQTLRTAMRTERSSDARCSGKRKFWRPAFISGARGASRSGARQYD